jgi:nicotinamidase/pyrazinamidase
MSFLLTQQEDNMSTIDRRAFLAAAGGLAAAAMFTACRTVAGEKIGISDTDVFLLIDVQNCFMPGGTLPVGKGDEIVPLVNRLAKGFKNVVMTQDWHPAGHISFASTHKKKPFEVMEMVYGTQVMWPDHCIQGTADGSLHKDLSIPHAQLIIRKGYNSNVDGYSAFLDLDGKTSTGLAGYLQARGIKRVFLAGLATDFCVMWSATDAKKLGFEALVVEDACRHIDVNGSLAAAWKKMDQAGVKRIQSADLSA